MIIFTWSWIFRNLKRTYQGCKLTMNLKIRENVLSTGSTKRGSSLPLCSCLFLSFAVCLYLCLSVCLSLFLYLSVSVTHTYFTLLWRFWNSCSVVRPLGRKEWWWLKDHTAWCGRNRPDPASGKLGFLLSAINQLWASWQIISMGLNGHWKKVILVLWIVSKSWWMLLSFLFFFFLMNAFLSSSCAIVILGTKLSL